MNDRHERPVGRADRMFGGSAPGDLAASPFRADRDRIVTSPFFARLGGVTQVISPGGSGLLVHNRLTHSLKVAQVARAVAERLVAQPRYADLLARLGGCDPDVVEAAALAHDLGHPPFGHLGESVLDRIARTRLHLPDGFEGNAQSYRIVTSTELRGSSLLSRPDSPPVIGLDLTAAVRAALLKYPWTRASFPDPHPSTMDPAPRGARPRGQGSQIGPRGQTEPAQPSPADGGSGSAKFGVYGTELADLHHARAPFAGRLPDWQQTVEASIMDTADDIAYAIHDIEDFHRVGVLQSAAVAAELRTWQATAAELAKLDQGELLADARRPGYATERLRRDIARKDPWISDDDAFAAAVAHVSTELVDGLLSVPFDGSIEAEQAVTGFSARWTRRLVEAIDVIAAPTVRSGHVVLAPVQWHEVQVLKLVHHRFVLARPDLALHQRGQARLLVTLVDALLAWLTDPDETARLPQRLRNLVDLAEAELDTAPDARPGGVASTVPRIELARGRAIIDFIAALTDGQVVALLDAVSGRSGQLWTDAFVL